METKEGKPIKVLLADDDADDRELFRIALAETDSSAKLTAVEDGDKLTQYLFKVDGHSPDIIFLDINMPCKNGKQCLREIRSNRMLKHIPVIMFSTSYDKGDVDETFSDGANRYVPKPVLIKDLVKILQKIFSSDSKENFLNTDRKNFVLQANNLASRGG
jgi:CheY-like chemotaxis protein